MYMENGPLFSQVEVAKWGEFNFVAGLF